MLHTSILLFLFLRSAQVFAIVPTIDEHQLSDDLSTMMSYGTSMGGYLTNLSKTITAVDQVQQLHGLQQVEAVGSSLCALCSLTDQKQLQSYIDDVNNDLCSQFSWAISNITGLEQNVGTINQIIQLFQTNPKAAAIALQQAVVQTQVSTQNTIAQVQVLMSQQAQKQLAEQKMEKQNTNDIYAGFRQSGL